jgi:hypothetical protein
MTQNELYHEIAQATGESFRTVAEMGFVPLTRGPIERDREPLVVDWDALDASREMLHPVG